MKELRNKVAVVTGAGSGIGRQLAHQLARAGAELVLADVVQKNLETTVGELHGQTKITSHVVDVSKRDQVYALADAALKDHGQVDIVINNAGVAVLQPLDQVSYEDFEWVMNVNFWGVVYGTQAFLPHLKKSGDGHVINTSSLFGLMAVPTQGTYNATKFAVRGYTEALRMELELAGEPVSATCVHPGGIATNIAKAGKFDDSMERVAGVSIDKQRKMADKMISTTTAESAALQILKAVENNERRVLVGPDARILDKLVRLMGSAYQVLIVRRLRRMRTQ